MIICVKVRYCSNTGMWYIALTGNTLPIREGYNSSLRLSVSFLKTATHKFHSCLDYTITIYNQTLFCAWNMSHSPYTHNIMVYMTYISYGSPHNVYLTLGYKGSDKFKNTGSFHLRDLQWTVHSFTAKTMNAFYSFPYFLKYLSGLRVQFKKL